MLNSYLKSDIHDYQKIREPKKYFNKTLKKAKNGQTEFDRVPTLVELLM
jgi:hypothetical protein